MSLRRVPYERAKQPPPMRLTERDYRILETIYAFDGVLSLKQIDQLFFSGQNRSQPRARMRLLFDNGYVNAPSKTTIHRVPQGESIYWLGRKGAEVVAGLQGESLRRFPWRRQPRYALLNHDLAINDVRLTMMQACQQDPTLSLSRWIPESELFAYPDTVAVPQPKGKPQQRQVRPDGFFAIQRQGDAHPFAYLLEMDMATKDNPRFIREKVEPGKVYLKSDTFHRRFGLRYGRYLVVTTGKRRLANMKAEAERAGGSGLFYFTTYQAITPTTVLHQPIWHLAGETIPRCILPPTKATA
ncbi:MAG: replication-relaxation family protein [Anaerolineae bacterium]|nr:replication-relaxation family protein [Anaerolineae bacterium]